MGIDYKLSKSVRALNTGTAIFGVNVIPVLVIFDGINEQMFFCRAGRWPIYIKHEEKGNYNVHSTQMVMLYTMSKDSRYLTTKPSQIQKFSTRR